MMMHIPRRAARPVRLLALAALAAAALALAAFAAPAANADQPGPGEGPQAIVVGAPLSITTNQAAYTVGGYATICYTVPAAGYIQITDHQGGTVKTLLAGYDDGTGDCFGGTVTPPIGQECLRIRYWFPQGGSISKQTCFTVLPQFPFPI